MDRESRKPRKSQRTRQATIHAGVEKVLYLAAVDRDFFEDLLERRDAAAKERGFVLRDSEAAVLRFAKPHQLQASIDALDVSGENVERRRFLKSVAAGAMAVTAGAVMEGCSDDDVKVDMHHGRDTAGITPDTINLDVPHGYESAGISPNDAGPPDVPASDTFNHDMASSFGIRPKG